MVKLCVILFISQLGVKIKSKLATYLVGSSTIIIDVITDHVEYAITS